MYSLITPLYRPISNLNAYKNTIVNENNKTRNVYLHDKYNRILNNIFIRNKS